MLFRSEMLTKLKDENGKILVPGMYDDVTPPTAEEKASWDSLPFDEEEFRKTEVGSTQLTGEPGFSVMERTWARPTLEVHGIVGGYMAPGAKTVIPAKATAKVVGTLAKLFIVHDHDAVLRAHLVRVPAHGNLEGGQQPGIARIGDVVDGGAIRWPHGGDVKGGAVDPGLSAAVTIDMRDQPGVVRAGHGDYPS